MPKKNAKLKKAVPELRFPGFNSPWKYEPLGKVIREHKRKNKDGWDVCSVSLEKGLINQIEHMGRSFSAKDTSNYNRVAPFDVVYTKSPLRDYPYGIVKQCRLDSDVAVSPLYGVFAPANEHLGLLVEAYFDSPYRSKRFIAPLAQKGAKNTINITNQTFLSGELFMPSDEAEQQKIANCLGSLDELIAAHRAKRDSLQDQKISLLQQLFPAPGQTTPTLRFAGFSGEWQPTKAGTLLKNRSERGVDGLEIFSVTMNEGLVIRSSLGRKFGDIAKSSGNKRAYKADIVYNMMRMWQGACGVAPKDCLVSPAYIVLKPTKKAHSPFFGHLFKRPESKQKLTAHSRGLTEDRLRLYYEDFALIDFHVPSFEEQKRISDCLTSLDALVNAEFDTIVALLKHKKALMQQLFPNPDLNKL